MHVKRRVERTKQDDVVSRATGRMQAQKLIDLIDQSAPDDSVVDLHGVDFADGTRRIPIAPADEGAVVAVVEGSADTTRRMSAVEWDAVAAVVESEVRSESTMRMSAIQANELVALITPVEVSLLEEAEPRLHEQEIATQAPIEVREPIVTFRAPTVRPEEPVIEPPSRRGPNPWMIGALFALAGAIAGLVAVVTL